MTFSGWKGEKRGTWLDVRVDDTTVVHFSERRNHLSEKKTERGGLRVRLGERENSHRKERSLVGSEFQRDSCS